MPSTVNSEPPTPYIHIYTIPNRPKNYGIKKMDGKTADKVSYVRTFEVVDLNTTYK